MQCYNRIVKMSDDGYDVNDTSINQANKSMSTAEVSLQQQGQNQTNSAKESSDIYYGGLDWWGICNNSLVRSYISQPCDILVTPDHRALTSQGKIELESPMSERSICAFYNRIVLWIYQIK
jgi:hypothetical protein